MANKQQSIDIIINCLEIVRQLFDAFYDENIDAPNAMQLELLEDAEMSFMTLKRQLASIRAMGAGVAMASRSDRQRKA